MNKTFVAYAAKVLSLVFWLALSAVTIAVLSPIDREIENIKAAYIYVFVILWPLMFLSGYRPETKWALKGLLKIAIVLMAIYAAVTVARVYYSPRAQAARAWQDEPRPTEEQLLKEWEENQAKRTLKTPPAKQGKASGKAQQK